MVRMIVGHIGFPITNGTKNVVADNSVASVRTRIDGYITKLPVSEHEAEEWQAAMEALILVAEHGGPTMFCSCRGERGARR
jgi:hypothetical protein